MLTREQMELLQKIESLQDDGSEGYPFSQEELDLIVSSLRALEKDAERWRIYSEASDFDALMETCTGAAFSYQVQLDEISKCKSPGEILDLIAARERGKG